MMHKWLKLLLFAALAAAAAAAEREAGCPRDCTCIDDFELKLTCNVSDHREIQLRLKTPKYAVVNCEQYALEWSEEGTLVVKESTESPGIDEQWLPQLPAVPALLNVTMDMMSFESCPVPREGGWGGAVRALGASGAGRLFLRDAPLRALDPALMRDLPQIKAIEFRDPLPAGAEIWSLHRELFEVLPHLIKLSVSGVHVRLEPRALASASPPPPLEVLELSSGWVEGLPAGAFQGLGRLRRLSLWKANVSAVPEGAFNGLSALEVLDLSGNELSNLNFMALSGLGALRELHILGSKLRELEPLSALTRLEMVAVTDCTAGALAAGGGVLAGLGRLRAARLQRCGIAALDEDALRGSLALQDLSLAENALRTLPGRLLRDQARLERLDLSRNQLAALPSGLLDGLHALIELNLEHNHITDLHADAFSGLSVSTLRLAHNELRLGALRLEEGGALSPLRDLPLELLDLQHNNISEIYSDWVLSLRLRYLDLSYNQITFLSDGDLEFISNSIKVDLSHNKITTVLLRELPPSVTESPDGIPARGNVSVQLADNPFDCDCRLHTFVRRLRGEGGGRVTLRAATARCAAPRVLAAEPLASVPLLSLRCALPAPACPAHCACALRPEGLALEMRCAEPPPPAASPRPRDYGLLDVELRLLEPPPAALNLSDDVRMLNLSGLGLRAAPALAAARGLRRLDLSRNEFVHAPLDLLARRADLTLRLAENPLRCDCDSVADFDRLLQNTSKVEDFDMVQCVSESGELVWARGGAGAARCGARAALWAVAAALLLAAGALGLLYYRFERELKVLLYARGCCGRWLAEREAAEDASARYDAFVSYSHKDADWVLGELAPRLEAGGRGRRPLRLCLHQRDWVPGEWIPTQIARSVEQSRRTLLVLSEHFLSSVWAREEWHAAHVRALRERRPRVLVVRLGPLPAAALPPDLRNYLAAHTYLDRSDPRFWDKLLYALPRVPRAPPAAALPASLPAGLEKKDVY